MLAHVVLAVTGLVAVPTGSSADVAPQHVGAAGSAAVVVVAGSTDDPTPPTINEFLPEDRGLGECISALPKPGCGSEARGGWRQGLILLAIVAALGFIAWRVVTASRRARVAGPPGGEPERSADATGAHRDGSP